MKPTSMKPKVLLSITGSRLQWLCYWQGAGTAIGELPPYFMARAARLSGDIDEEEQEIEELMQEQQNAEHLVCVALFVSPASVVICSYEYDESISAKISLIYHHHNQLHFPSEPGLTGFSSCRDKWHRMPFLLSKH